jgi:hypothetical protein
MKEIDQFTYLELEDKGKYGFNLTQGYKSKSGDFRPSFCRREVGKDKIEKLMPLNIKLGDRAKAIEVCLYLYQELTGKSLEDAPF